LIFITSYKGESTKTQINFNAKQLNEYLIPGEYEEYDLLKVLDKVTNQQITNEQKNKHYFKVIMNNVKNIDHILEYEDIRLFLSQIAPVPYNKNLFSWENKIKNKFNKHNISLKEYNIMLTNGNKKDKIFKLYTDKFVSNRKRKIQDEIEDIDIEFIKDKSNNVIAAIWYSVSNLHGTIVNKKKKGIRLRKGNFQIGDRFILNNIFKEDRFNGWFQGEVQIFDNKIIPNARRDNLEKNNEYYYLLNQLKDIGEDLSKEIRKQSKIRNKLKHEKNTFLNLDILSGENDSEINNKILDLKNHIPLKERKVLDKVFTILNNFYEEKDIKEEIFKTIISNY